MTERIQKLRNGLFESIPAICPERAVLFTESMKKTEGQPIVKRRADAFYQVLDHMTIFVRDGELLVGNQASSVHAAPVFLNTLPTGLLVNLMVCRIIFLNVPATNSPGRRKQKIKS